MIEFSIWDIFRNLLLAARWTVVLSLVAFIGGGLVGALLLVGRLSAARSAPGAQKPPAWYAARWTAMCCCSRARRC